MTDGILRSITRGNTITQAPAPAFVGTLLLDIYPNALVAYSLRRLRTAYAGSAIRIRRSSDNAESDIGFSGDDFDAAAAATFISGTGYVVTWYDQSGNGRDITQSSGTAQPIYRATGLLSLPSVEFYDLGDGTGDELSRTSVDFGTVTQGTLLSVMFQVGSHAQHTLFSHASAWVAHATYDDVIYWDFGGSGGSGRLNIGQPGGWDDTGHILELYRSSGDSQGIVVDGVSLATGSRTDDVSGSQTFRLGAHPTGIFHKGFISEFVLWGTDLAGSRSGARTNMNDYYSVF